LCWACLKTGGGKANPYFSGDRQKPWAIGNGPSPPLYAQMNCAYPFFEATPRAPPPDPGPKPGPVFVASRGVMNYSSTRTLRSRS